MEEITQICFDSSGTIGVAIALGASVISSLLANKFDKGSLIGKAINWIALNFTVEKKK